MKLNLHRGASANAQAVTAQPQIAKPVRWQPAYEGLANMGGYSARYLYKYSNPIFRGNRKAQAAEKFSVGLTR
jgi:hypothetical protein